MNFDHSYSSLLHLFPQTHLPSLVPSLLFYNQPGPICAARTYIHGWRTSHWIVGKLTGNTPQILSPSFSQILIYDIKFTVLTWESTLLQTVGEQLLHSCSCGICLKDTVLFQAQPDGILLAWASSFQTAVGQLIDCIEYDFDSNKLVLGEFLWLLFSLLRVG